MKNITIYFVILIILASKCQESNSGKGGNLDPYEPLPFEFTNYNESVILPDSLKIFGSGKAVIDLFLNNEGNIMGFNIKFIKLDSIRYFKYLDHPELFENYPHDVQKFFPFISNYVDLLELKRDNNDKIKPKDKYVISLPLNLK